MIALVFALVLLAGYATQRGGICAVAATEALVRRGRPDRLLAFLFCAAVGLTLLAAATVAGRSAFAVHAGSAALLLPALGGAIFGAGAWLNGACAFGTVADLGSGRLARLATLAGFLGGSVLAFHAGLAARPPDFVSPLAGWPALTILIVAAAVALALAIELARRSSRRRGGGGWPPAAAMALIGAVNAVLLLLAARWPYTSLLMDLARMAGGDLVRRALMALCFLAGAVAGAVAARDFRLVPGRASLWLRSAAGGALMAAGAALAPGGNDTMLLVGLPLLLPNLVAAYAAMAGTLILIEYLARTVSLRG